MKRIGSIIGAAMLLFALSACSGKTPPQPEGLMGKKLLTSIRALEHSYEKRDLGGFMGNVLPSAANRGEWERSIKTVFAKYDQIHFSFHNTKMLVMMPDRGNIKASVNWDAEWSTTSGEQVKDSGRVTLVFDPKDLLLADIEGKNPFVPAVTPVKQ